MPQFSIQPQPSNQPLTDFQPPKTKLGSVPFGKETEGKIDPFQAVLSPGGVFIEPGLKKIGVPSGLAFGIGLGVDVAIPGPGEELSKIKFLEDLSKQIQSKLRLKAPLIKAKIKATQIEELSKIKFLEDLSKQIQSKLRLKAPLIKAKIKATQIIEKAKIINYFKKTRLNQQIFLKGLAREIESEIHIIKAKIKATQIIEKAKIINYFKKTRLNQQIFLKGLAREIESEIHKNIEKNIRTTGKPIKAAINILKKTGQIPETIYRNTLKELVGKESLREMGVEELKKVRDYVAKLPKDVEGKLIPIEIPNIRGIKISKEFAERVGQLKDLGSVEGSPISLLDPLRAAEKLDVAEEGIIKKTLIRPVQEADKKLLEDSQQILTKVKGFVGKIKSGSKQDRLIRTFGEKETYPENFTDDIAKQITPEIKKAAEGFRELYDDLLTKANQARKFAGQKEIPKRKDYFTHAEELGLFSSLFGRLDKIPGEMLRVAEFTKPNAPFFKFALPRLGRKTTAGAIEGFQRYLNSVLPVIHYAKPIVNLRAHIPYLPPRASKYFNDWVNELAGKTHPLDRPIPKQLLAIGDWLRSHTSQGSVLGNFTTSFNQLSSVASTISRVGLKKSIVALPASLSDSGIAFAEMSSKVLKARRYDPDINPATLGSIKNFLGWGLETLDRFSVRHSFLAAHGYATDKLGLIGEEAIRFADDIAQKTQASTRKIFQPPFLRSRVGGTLGQLQTFTTNLYNQIRRDIPLIAKTKGGLEAVKVAMSLGISAIFINKVYRELGIPEPYNLTSFIPGVGSFKYGAPSPALRGPFGVLRTTIGEGETREEGIKDIRSFIFSLIPGGRQLQKTGQGIEAIREGGSRTKTGKLRFPIEGTIEEIRALLFGPFETKAGQEYLRKQKEK